MGGDRTARRQDPAVSADRVPPRLPTRTPSLLHVSAVVTAVLLGWFWIQVVHPFGPPVLNWLLLPASPVLAVLAIGRVTRESGLATPARRLWRCTGLSAAALAVAVVSYAYDALAGPDSPTQDVGPLTQSMFMMAVFVSLWGVVQLPVRRRRRAEWLTVSLDTAIVLIASGLLAGYAMTRVDVVDRMPQLSTALCGLVGVVIAIKVSLTGFTGIDPSAIRALGGAVLIGTLTGATAPMLAGRTDLNNAMLSVPLACAGLVYAAHLQSRALRRQTPDVARRRVLPFSLLPYIAVVCTDAVLLVADHDESIMSETLITGSVALTGLVIFRQMISFRDNRHYQDQLAHQATHDDLTGLANRSLFTERTARALATAAPGTVTVALLDLDDFKSINDRLGHTVGDTLLTELSTHLSQFLRPQDHIARLGGDEFAILLTGLRPRQGALIATRILAMLTHPIATGDHNLLVQASIGLADNVAGPSATTAADLLRRADIAMYAAKEQGKNRYAQFNLDLDARTVEHAQLAADLSHALGRDELHLLYQPIVELPAGRIVGVEALVRWHHPLQGLVSPVHFIPVAERTGQIVPIGAWILATACRQAARWDRLLGDRAPARVTVNVSARQLLEPDFPGLVARVLAETGLEPTRLTIEITETAVFGGGRTVDAVTAIRDLGVAIALDDFGTGHSSLGLLRTCPVDVLKVDKSFVDGVTGTLQEEAIATSVVQIAHALGLRTIAEGVETPAQAARLHALGYRFAQGFHFARPKAAAEIEQMIRAEPAAIAAAYDDAAPYDEYVEATG